MKSLPHVFCFVLIIMMCLSSLIFAQDEPDEIGSFIFEDYERYYEVYLPQDYQPNMPLVISLHGYTETIEWYKGYTLLHEVADTSGYIIVYPKSKPPSWNTGESFPLFFPAYDSTMFDVGFISALIDSLYNKYEVDLSRVYSCGFSSGGMMASRLTLELGHRFAAVASVAGPLNGRIVKMHPPRSIPILFMHGTDDAFISYEAPPGNLWSAKQTQDYWVESNNCPSQADTITLPDLDPYDGATVEKITYENCLGDSTVIHYKIIEGGHNWPGAVMNWDGEGNKCMDINANVEILNFFNKFQNPLVNIAYAKSREVFYSVQNDTLIIRAIISNPNNHPVSVHAIYQGGSYFYKDSLQLFDDGLHGDGDRSDNIFGGIKWLSGITQDRYKVKIKTTDKEADVTTYIHHPEYFVTQQPVVNAGDFGHHYRGRIFRQFLFQLKLENQSQEATAFDVGARVKLLSEDSCFTIIGKYREYGDIAPGEIAEGYPNQYFSMNVDTNCLEVDSLYIPFLLEIESRGSVFWTDTFSIDIVNVVDNIDDDFIAYVEKFSLDQNYPNPFNPRTIINYELPITNEVDLSIYNLLGQKVATLVSEKQKAGFHQVEWDASGFASGIYYYKIEAGEFMDVKKMILLR